MKQVRFVLRAAAQRDLDALADYFEAEAGKDTALRFLDSARVCFGDLGNSPHLGPAVNTRNADLAAMRKWRVTGFPSYLIFYRPEEEWVRILRVLHGAQDWWAMLDIASKGE